MTRPWCVGIMVSAFSNDVNIAVVHLSDHLPLTDDDLDNLVKLLGIEAPALIEHSLSFSQARVVASRLGFYSAAFVNAFLRSKWCFVPLF